MVSLFFARAAAAVVVEGEGTLEDVTVRIYAKSGSYESRGDDEFTLEYVP